MQSDGDECGDETLLYLVEQMIGNMAQKMVMEVLNEDDKTVWFDGVLLPRYTIKIVNVKQTSITICQTTVDLYLLFNALDGCGLGHESLANDFLVTSNNSFDQSGAKSATHQHIMMKIRVA